LNQSECPKTKKDLSILQWKEGGQFLGKSVGVGDATDALSYFTYNYLPLIENKMTGIIL
jgi:hypothetical protein